MKVETDTIASITESPVGRGAILEIMYVETFKTDIVFIRNIIMCLRSHRLIILSISQFIDTHSLGEVEGKMSILLIHVCTNMLKLICDTLFLDLCN
jgi:hypothetical protein